MRTCLTAVLLVAWSYTDCICQPVSKTAFTPATQPQPQTNGAFIKTHCDCAADSSQVEASRDEQGVLLCMSPSESSNEQSTTVNQVAQMAYGKPQHVLVTNSHFKEYTDP